jgi:hypothetical protein
MPRINGEIPSDIDLAPMLGQEMVAFTIGKHHLELAFSDMRLVVEAGYELSQSGKSPQLFSRGTLVRGAALMPPLLSCTVQSAEWLAGRGLLISFSGGTKFLALADNSGYESFSFELPNQAGAVVV